MATPGPRSGGCFVSRVGVDSGPGFTLDGRLSAPAERPAELSTGRDRLSGPGIPRGRLSGPLSVYSGRPRPRSPDMVRPAERGAETRAGPAERPAETSTGRDRLSGPGIPRGRLSVALRRRQDRRRLRRLPRPAELSTAGGPAELQRFTLANCNSLVWSCEFRLACSDSRLAWYVARRGQLAISIIQFLQNYGRVRTWRVSCRAGAEGSGGAMWHVAGLPQFQ